MLPLSKEEKQALRMLQGESSVIRDALESDILDLGDLKRDPKNTTSPPLDRASDLTKLIKNYLINMSQELEELPDERKRLESEAVGLVVALREIYAHFPELEKRV